MSHEKILQANLNWARKAAHQYDKKNEFCKQVLQIYESDANFIHEILRVRQDPKILELGCGTGMFSRWFLDKGYSLEGLDISQEMLNEMEQGPSHARPEMDAVWAVDPRRLPVQLQRTG